jgi:hypothetical protein
MLQGCPCRTTTTRWRHFSVVPPPSSKGIWSHFPVCTRTHLCVYSFSFLGTITYHALQFLGAMEGCGQLRLTEALAQLYSQPNSLDGRYVSSFVFDQLRILYFFKRAYLALERCIGRTASSPWPAIGQRLKPCLVRKGRACNGKW